MSDICVNKVISDFESGAQYLVLWIAPGNEYGYWYDLNSRSCKPARFELDNVVTGESSWKYEIADYSSVIYHSERTITETERVHRDRIWVMMQAAVESEPEIYESRTRFKMLRMIAKESHTSPNNLYRYLDKYWRYGKTKNAFIPSFQNRGGKGRTRNGGDKKIGRNPYDDGAVGKILTKKDQENFACAVKTYYLNRNKFTFTAVYEKLLEDFYSTKNKDNPEQKKLLPPDELPSIRQFRYWYSRNCDITTEQKKRDGAREFELTGRSVLGRSDYGLMGPGAQFQIDATVGDIYLLSQFDHNSLIGRPVMYFVVDAFSRMITGMSIGLEGPSWRSAMTAIVNMAADKVAYCREYGIEITDSEWPCRHVPSVLRGDRGEMESKNADNLVNMLGIRIENTPPYRADLKGIIEQQFCLINTNCIAMLPGNVKPDMSKRGGHDYRLDAKLDIRQFTRIIIKCVLYYNNHHFMDYIELSEALIRGQVEAIPIKLWNWGIRNCSGALRSFPEEQVRLAVMPTDKASITGKGIRFKGLFYSSDRAVREAWFEKARAKKTWQVTVSYDPRDMAAIYVWNNDDKVYDVCALLDWNSKNAGKCLDEIIYEQRKEKIGAKQFKAAETEAKVNLNAEIDAIVNEAQDMSKDLPQKNKQERVTQIKENRRRERESLQTTAAADIENAAAAAANPTVADNEMSPVLRMIKQKMEERLKHD